MAAKFGNTWWGDAWLHSLSDIDYENRIPRGARYARNGAVTEIKFVGNTINAKVQGTRPKPYRVMIVIPPFSENEVERLMSALLKKPGIISKLLARELSPEIVRIADECGLKVFPKRWTDLKMNCSCPDWAVPCKHLAAVVYMMSREIDNNPFLVFQMHGVDLLDELRKRGITALENADEQTQVPSMNSLLHCLKKQEVKEEIDSSVSRLNFTHLSDCTEPLLLLLPDNPPFLPTLNFKNTYSDEIHRVVKGVNRFFSGKMLGEGLFPVAEEVVDIRPETELSFTIDENMRWTVNDMPSAGLNADTLPQALLRLNPDFLPDYSRSVTAAHQALFLALHLAAKGCIMPQITQLANKCYIMRWVPAYVTEAAHELVRRLEEMMPTTLVGILPSGKKRRKVIGEGRGECLVSFFLERIVNNLTANSQLTYPVARLFFKGEAQSFDGVGEKETAGGIKAWIDHLCLTESDWRIVFNVSETADRFDLQISVEDKREPQSAPTPLSEVLQSARYDSTRFEILR